MHHVSSLIIKLLHTNLYKNYILLSEKLKLYTYGTQNRKRLFMILFKLQAKI